MGGSATEIAERRHTVLASLRKELAGDLNWIVMKAVEKSRDRRYPAVADLAADIQRHLDDRPVLASPPSQMYRVRKFVRRNKVGVLAAAAVCLAVLGGFAATAWEATVANRERATAVRERAEAVRQKTLAEARSQEAATQRNRAEEQTAAARRQEQVAEQQSALAEARLGDVQSLANSMFTDLDDQIRYLPGSTPARETMARLGLEYLSKVSGDRNRSPELQRQLGAAYLKIGELAGDPRGSSLRDLRRARDSFDKSVTLLEAQVKANPRDPGLRHQLTIATLRRAQLQESEAEQRAGYAQTRRLAEKLAQDEPANLQAQSDLAEVLGANKEQSLLMLTCEGCAGSVAVSDADIARAVAIRERILAADPRSPAARLELAQAQIALGNTLTNHDDKKAFEALAKALASLEALNKEAPANVQYQRERARALFQIGLADLPLNRVDDAVERERQAVAIQEQLAAADPRNAGFRQDLSAYLVALGKALRPGSKGSESLDALTRALAIQQEQAALHPDNPDFALQTALIREAMGIAKGQNGDFKAALQEDMEAEPILRKLVKDNPRRRDYARALAADVLLEGGAMYGAKDYVSAMDRARQAFTIYRSLASEKNAVDDDFRGLAQSHDVLGLVLLDLRRQDEAIAEDRAAIAEYERLIARNPSAKNLRQSLSLVWAQLSYVYRTRAEYRAAVDASLKALPFLEEQYAEQPGEPVRTAALWEALFLLRTQYSLLGEYEGGIEAARRSVEIAEKSASLQPEDRARAQRVTSSYINLAGTLNRSGRREESLAASRKVVALNEPSHLPVEPDSRVRAADQILYSVENFRYWEEQAEALPLCRSLLPVLTEAVANAPSNARFRGTLALTYTDAADIELDLGNYAQSADDRRKGLAVNLEQPRSDAGFWLSQGRRTLLLATALELAGRKGEAEKSRRDSLELFNRSRDAASTAAGKTRNPAALDDVYHANTFAAVALEQLGDLREALRFRKLALDAANAAVKEGSSDPASANEAESALASWARVSSLVEPGKPADADPRRTRWLTARGSREWAWDLQQVTDQPNVELMRKAVEMFRALAAENRADSIRELGVSLQDLGVQLKFLARSKKGPEWATVTQQSRDAFAESLGILQALKTPLDAGRPSAIFADLATIDAKLATYNTSLNAGNPARR